MEQILILMVLLIGLGFVFGGGAFLRRIGSMFGGCVQFILTALILLLLFLFLMMAANRALLGG